MLHYFYFHFFALGCLPRLPEGGQETYSYGEETELPS